ncbi:MAG: DNA primase [Candidatus Falkowbacteria bacterium]|nr:DNA primase [Candidatus Falkowbacteria bacterium]
MSQVEDIKARLDIVELIREYITVKAVGANFQALCPFHHEKTPSFVISPEKQIWHCFGCGRGGDVLSFVMEMENLGFGETLRLLAPKAGITLRYEDSNNYSQRNRLLDILDLAGKYFTHQLGQNSKGLECREYLLARGLSEETIKDWQLGYSPETRGLIDFLGTRPKLGKKYTPEEIFLAGLALKNESGQYYERFRDRIMFPIWDINNNIIAFTARVNPLKEASEKLGKYINSPQTEVYDKSQVLFALNRAKKNIKKENLAIIVEGQMDAISAHQHGFSNVVASSGTALSSAQLKLIKRFTSNIALAFDMDKAGQMAADRGLKEAMTQDFNIKVIILPNGKDPDECLRNNPADFKTALTDAPTMMEYYFNQIKKEFDFTKIAERKLAVAKLLNMIAKLANKIEEDFWLKTISAAADVPENILRETVKNALAKVQPGSSKETPLVNLPQASLSREERMSELFLSLLLKFPDFLEYSLNNLDPDYLVGEPYQLFYRNLIIYYNKTTVLDYQSFREYLMNQDESLGPLLDKISLLGDKDFYDYTPANIKNEIIKIIIDLKKSYWQAEIKVIEKELAQAEPDGNKDRVGVLMSDLKILNDKLRQIQIANYD